MQAFSVLIFLIYFFKKSSQLLWILLGFHVVTLCHYKISENHLRSTPLPILQTSITQFQLMTFNLFRVPHVCVRNQRDRILKLIKSDGGYASVNMLLFKDELGHALRTDNWLKPFDYLMRAYDGKNLDALELPSGSRINYLDFLMPKIQFFNNAYRLPDDESIAKMIARPEYNGGTLFLTSDDKNIPIWDNSDLTLNHHLMVPYTINDFSANHLKISVDVPDGKDVWMYYADIWDKNWKVFVDEKETPLYKSHIAYKSVQLHARHNVVDFRYDVPKLRYLYLFWQICALFWGIFLTLLLVGEFKNKSSTRQ